MTRVVRVIKGLVPRVVPCGKDVRATLREVFGHADFRFGQRAAVESISGGRDTVVLLPTGAGKSLCYQVPAVAASRMGEGTTLVISPLIALMRDQVNALCGHGVQAAALNSHQSEGEQREVVERLLAGDLELLYVSPERAVTSSFKRLLGRALVALVAIDEAHCVSQWGHDFRPEYMRLHELRAVVDAPMIAVTATATRRVMDEIVSRLELCDPVEVRGSFNRPNLRFSVQHLRTDLRRLAATAHALEEAGLRARSGAGRAVVYCSTRKKTETVVQALKSTGFPAGYYHAGRTQLARERAQRSFDSGRIRVLVATNAFGMGIDYPDVRLIVHFQTPGSLEAYYQEAGRAGRDGEAAQCVLFFGPGDLVTQRRLSSASSVSSVRSEGALQAVERYARDARCRQQMLCAHFGVHDSDACGLCDVCTGGAGGLSDGGDPELERAVPIVTQLPAEAQQLILSAVGRLRRPVGKTNLARALRGSKAKSLGRGGLLMLVEYGALSEHSEASIVRSISGMLADGRLERRGRKYPTVWIPGRPVRVRTTAGATDGTSGSQAKPGVGRGTTDLARGLENYRRRMARSLQWKPYMVFQRRVITELDRQRPDTRDGLARIPGLGVAKIERFGADILDLIHACAQKR